MSKTIEPINVAEGPTEKGGRKVDVNKVVRHTKESFAKLIEKYKHDNPVKYAEKKDELEKKLAALK